MWLLAVLFLLLLLATSKTRKGNDIPDAMDNTPENDTAENTITRTTKSNQSFFNQFLTLLFVNTAVTVKQSPLPDMITLATDLTLETYKTLDTYLGISSVAMNTAQYIAKKGVFLSGVLANASIKAGIAYQKTPGYLRDNIIERVIIQRVDAVPGSYPFTGGTVETSTQTETLESVRKKKSLGDLMYSITERAHSYGVYYLRGTTTTVDSKSVEKIITPKKHPIRLFYEDAVIESADLVDTNEIENDTKNGHVCDTQEIICLNVGGYMYSTTRSVLCTFPTSDLALYFTTTTTTTSQVITKSKDYYFLDLDGYAFYFVLSFLRAHAIRTQDNTISQIQEYHVLEQVLRIARIFKLRVLERRVYKRMCEMEASKRCGVYFEVVRGLVSLIKYVVNEVVDAWDVAVEKSVVFEWLDKSARIVSVMDVQWMYSCVMVFVVLYLFAM
jgi:hypothetical protein